MLELNVHKNAPTIWVPYSSLAEMQCNLLDKNLRTRSHEFHNFATTQCLLQSQRQLDFS